MDYGLIDTHCHLDFPEFDSDRQKVVAQAQHDGIERIINIGSSLQGSERSVALAKEYPCIFATVGLHPHEADKADDRIVQAMRALTGQEKVVAIGETGLDYFKNYSSQENQKRLFRESIELAKEKRLPLVVHSRQAQADTVSILKEYMPLAAVVHCFSGDAGFLRECLELGFLISFTCNITYKKAADLRGFVQETPLSRLMLETDAPFLSPEGSRGKRNEPAQVSILAQEIAKIKGLSVEDIGRATTFNAKQFFGLP